MGPSPPFENLWEISDGLWAQIQPVLLAADPPKATGRKRVDQRRMLDGIVYKFVSGCQWNRLPKELGDDSTIHRTYQRWVSLGVFERVWAMLEAESEELGGVPGGANGFMAATAGLQADYQRPGAVDPRRVG